MATSLIQLCSGEFILLSLNQLCSSIGYEFSSLMLVTSGAGKSIASKCNNGKRIMSNESQVRRYQYMQGKNNNNNNNN